MMLSTRRRKISKWV